MKRIVLGAGGENAGEEIVSGITKRVQNFAQTCDQPFTATYHSRTQNFAVYATHGMVFDDAMAQHMRKEFPGSRYNGDNRQLTIPVSSVPGSAGQKGNKFDPMLLGLVVRVVCIYVLVTRVIVPSI